MKKKINEKKKVDNRNKNVEKGKNRIINNLIITRLSIKIFKKKNYKLIFT